MHLPRLLDVILRGGKKHGWRPGGDTLRDGRAIPEGTEFFDLIGGQEDDCEQITDKAIPKLGVNAPQAYEQLGTVLSLLDRLASCWWGCPGGSHVIQYLVGRASTSARAALRLARMGFYDEALGLVRSVGEISNLLLLFGIEKAAFEEWLRLSDEERRRTFGPVHVRLRIEGNGLTAPIDQERYQQLSRSATHVGPNTAPQSYNIEGRPFLAPKFQEAGFVLILNELSVALVFVAFMAAQLVPVPENPKKRLEDGSDALVNTIGRLTIDEIPHMWDELRRQARGIRSQSRTGPEV